MKHAQITLFIIVGLVMVISVIAIIYIAQSATPENQETGIQAIDRDPEVCLQQATRAALSDLGDDGVLTTSESGPIAEPYHYISNESVETYKQGYPNYLGLCDTNGVNGLETSGSLPLSCDEDIYNYLSNESIQEQLDMVITNRTHECLNQSRGEATVFMQGDRIQVEFSEPEAQYVIDYPLQSVWAAIHEFVYEQIINTSYYVGQEGITITDQCENCQPVFVNRTEQTPQVDTYTFSVAGEKIVNITVQDRPLLIVTTSPLNIEIAVNQEYVATTEFMDADGLTYSPFNVPSTRGTASCAVRVTDGVASCA